MSTKQKNFEEVWELDNPDDLKENMEDLFYTMVKDKKLSDQTVVNLTVLVAEINRSIDFFSEEFVSKEEYEVLKQMINNHQHFGNKIYFAKGE